MSALDTGVTVSGAADAFNDNNVELARQKLSMQSGGSSSAITSKELMPTSQMSIRDLLNMETIASSFSITASTTVGTVLYKTAISPLDIDSDATTRVEYLSGLFRFWRGDVKFRFVSTKTILQQTKFLAVFVPGAQFDDPAPTILDAYYYTHKEVINPANETVPEFCVPFVSDRPYLKTSESTGVFYLLLFQPIVASTDPGSTNTIEMKIFVAADLEMHEMKPVPAIDIGGGVSFPSDFLFPLVVLASGSVNTISGTGSASFTTDSGAVQNLSVRTFGFSATSFPYEAFKPLFADNSTNQTYYTPVVFKTVYGDIPSSTLLSTRVICLPTDLGTGSTTSGVFIFITVGYCKFGVAFTVASVPVASQLKMYPEAIHTISYSFENDLTVALTMDDVTKRFEIMLARGDECSSGCLCAKCCLECEKLTKCGPECTCRECNPYHAYDCVCDRCQWDVVSASDPDSDYDCAGLMGDEDPNLYYFYHTQCAISPRSVQLWNGDFVAMDETSDVCLSQLFEVSTWDESPAPLDANTNWMRFHVPFVVDFALKNFVKDCKLECCSVLVKNRGVHQQYLVYSCEIGGTVYAYARDSLYPEPRHIKPFLRKFADVVPSARRALNLMC